MSKSIYDEALEELEKVLDIYEFQGYDIDEIEKIIEIIEQAQKKEKLLDMYREYFRLNSVPKGEWTTLLFNRLLEVQKIIKELENEINL